MTVQTTRPRRSLDVADLVVVVVARGDVAGPVVLAERALGRPLRRGVLHRRAGVYSGGSVAAGWAGYRSGNVLKRCTQNGFSTNGFPTNGFQPNRFQSNRFYFINFIYFTSFLTLLDYDVSNLYDLS